MPYTKDELNTIPYYQSLIRRDESKYIELIEKRKLIGQVENGVLRDQSSGNFILFEKIIPGQGTDGTSHPYDYLLSWTHGWFSYEENEELNKIIDREFTEL